MYASIGPDYKDRLEDRVLKYRLLIIWKSLMLLIVSFMGSAGLKMIFIIAKCKSNSGLNCSLKGDVRLINDKRVKV